MSHFYGTLQGARGPATRCGTKSSGVTVQAAGWGGCVETYVYREDSTDKFIVRLRPWQGSGGDTQIIAKGTLSSRVYDVVANTGNLMETNDRPPPCARLTR
jgi:hypothetical protein